MLCSWMQLDTPPLVGYSSRLHTTPAWGLYLWMAWEIVEIGPLVVKTEGRIYMHIYDVSRSFGLWRHSSCVLGLLLLCRVSGGELAAHRATPPFARIVFDSASLHIHVHTPSLLPCA